MWECGVTLNTTARRPHHEPVLVLFEHFIRTAAAVGLFFSLFFSFPQRRAAVATHSLYKTRAAADSRKNINSRSTFAEAENRARFPIFLPLPLFGIFHRGFYELLFLA